MKVVYQNGGLIHGIWNRVTGLPHTPTPTPITILIVAEEYFTAIQTPDFQPHWLQKASYGQESYVIVICDINMYKQFNAYKLTMIAIGPVKESTPWKRRDWPIKRITGPYHQCTKLWKSKLRPKRNLNGNGGSPEGAWSSVQLTRWG